MICDDCQEREAVLSIIEIVNGETRETHLCKQCAAKRGSALGGITGGSFLSKLLESVMNIAASEGKTVDRDKTNVRCPSCGQTYEDFLQDGKFGCPSCYRSFHFLLDSYLKKIQGGVRHTGKMPRFGGETVEIPDLEEETPDFAEGTGTVDEIRITVDPEAAEEELRSALKRAVAREDYEQAARIRDLLKERKGEDPHAQLV